MPARHLCHHVTYARYDRHGITTYITFHNRLGAWTYRLCPWGMPAHACANTSAVQASSVPHTPSVLSR